MERRRLLAGLGLALCAGCLTLAGCGTSVDSNVPEEKPATQADIDASNKAIQEQMKNMGKAPR